MSVPPPPDCVIWNPRSGKHRGHRRLERARQQLGSGVEWIPTTAPGSATLLAQAAVARGARQVVAAGGDGTFHEVARGLLLSGVNPLELGLLPIGSANDYAFSVTQELQQLPPGAPPVLTVDVGQVTAGPCPAAGGAAARVGFFLSGLGLGLNGMVTEEAHQIRWLQGLWLYGWATLKALRRLRGLPEMSIQVGEAVPWVGPTLLFSLLLGQREGNFRLAPEARLGDGWFNYIRSDLDSIPEILRLLPQVAWRGAPSGHPRVQLGLCQSARILARTPLTVHIDGELFCREADGITEVECRLLPARLQVRLWNPG